VDLASEFRYRRPVVDSRVLTVPISQSGKTADTLAALREAREHGSRAVAICNVVGSSLAREADGVVYTRAGVEIGVASTKAFTARLAAVTFLALKLGLARNFVEPTLARQVAKGALRAAGSYGSRAPAERRDTLHRRAGPRPLPGPRNPLPPGARRGAQAQGDLVHPCRGLRRAR
jgi:glutamine---fructose-6-phosphate transaminase (isomerizing)